MVSGIYLTNEVNCCTFTCILVRGRNKRLFPHTAHWTFTSRGGFSQMWILSRHYIVTPCWLVQGCMVWFSQIWGGFIQIPSLRACPNVETNTEEFPYSGNCSVLCGVDVYLRSQVQAYGPDVLGLGP